MFELVKLVFAELCVGDKQNPENPFLRSVLQPQTDIRLAGMSVG